MLKGVLSAGPLLAMFLLMPHTVFLQQVCDEELNQYKNNENVKRHSRVIDSLKQQGEKYKHDSSQLRMHLILAGEYIHIRYDSAVYYSETAISISEKVGDRAAEVSALIKRGTVEEICKRNWKGALRYYQLAMEKTKHYRLNKLYDELISMLHNTYYYLGNFPQAMHVANEGLQHANMMNDLLQQLHYTLLIADTYLIQEIPGQAFLFYQKAGQLANHPSFDEINSMNLKAMADVFYGIGNTYLVLGSTDSAILYLDKALKKFNAYRANQNFHRIYMLANIYWLKGKVFARMNNHHKALEYAMMALNLCNKKACNLYEKVNYYLLAGASAMETGNRRQAMDFIQRAGCLSGNNNHAENQRDVAYYMARWFAAEGKYDSAWKYNQRYMLLKDSISNERSRYRTQEINTVYQLAEKDRQIASQNNLRNILIASFILLLLTLVFLYNRNRLQQRNRYQQELNRQQNEMFNAISLAQEQERKRIAQDIHDSLGSVLSAAKLKMIEAKESKPELTTDEKFLSGIGLLDEASAELRNISHNIMPATLSKLGLIPALKNLCEKVISHKGLQVRFIAYDFENRANEQTEITIYRIVLELINNVVKHAAASRATVQLVKYPDYINITVEDNGRGFDTARTADEKKGIGLGSVAARVDYLKGKMDIDSMPGKGTTVVVDIPLAS
jgi:signal transduction histidine kinase